MKDKRFIELVNLYIDRQITEAETADLEMEMQNNPRRRAIYHQYCQMHRATTQVYESFRNEESAEACHFDGKPAVIARFQTPRRSASNHWTYYVAGIAAACAALIFVRSTSVGTSEVANVVAPFRSTSAVASVSPITPPPLAASPVVALDRSVAPRTENNRQNYTVVLATLRNEEGQAFTAGLVPNRRSSLFEDGIFDSQPNSPVVNQRVFVGKQVPEQATEFTAFQFQR